MRKITNIERLSHVQRFVREIYAEQLRQAGFFSYKNEDIHWFRITNNEVIHAVYFVAKYTGFPLMLEIGYGCHPLFIPPVLQQSPCLQPLHGYEQIYHSIPELIPGSMPYGVQRSFIHGLSNKVYREPDVLVHCPADDQTSRVILEKVLSVLESIDTPLACYEAHKHWRSSEINNDAWLTMTPYFVDEVLYWEDEALYPYCMHYVEERQRWLESVKRGGLLTRKAERDELAHLEMLRNVFEQKSREEYMLTLSEKANRHLAQLRKHTSL